MALAWSPFPRSDEQPPLLRPLAPPRAPTVFQAAPSFERIDPPTRRALARRRAAPALRPPPPPLADPEAPALMPPPPPVAMPPPPRFVPPADDDDDRSVASASSAALGIESSATSFSARDDLPAAAPPPFEPPDDDDDDNDEERSIVEDDISTVGYDSGDDTATCVGAGGARTASSRFWGVGWDRKKKKWQAYYKDSDAKQRWIGYFDDEEEAARALNKAIRDAGLAGRRRMNPVDETGALVPKSGHNRERDRSAVVAPDAARDQTATTSKFWGVSWRKRDRRWEARYQDADGKKRFIGLFDTQEAAAHAVNAAIRRAGLERKRRMNPVVDGQLVPRVRNSPGQGRRPRKRRREEAAATPSPRARRPRRVVNDDDSEPDADSDY